MNLTTTSPAETKTRGDRYKFTAVRVARRPSRGWLISLLLVVVAVAVRLAYWKFAVPHYHPISDAGQYYELGRNLAQGKGFAFGYPVPALHPTAFRPPVYPLLLSIWYLIFGVSVGAGQVLSLLTGAVTVLLVERLGRRLAGPVAGIVAGLAVAVYVPLLVNDVMLLSESLSMLLLAATLILLVDRRPIPAGITAGLLMLTRPSAQGLALVAALWLLWTVGWRRALSFVGVAVLLVGAWVIRNDIQLGSPVTFTSNGFNLAAIYSPDAQRIGVFDLPLRAQDFRKSPFNEIAWDHTLTQRGLDGIKHNPTYVVHVVKHNTESWFEIYHDDPAEVLDGRNIGVDHATFPEFYVFTFAGIVGLIAMRRRRETVLLIAVSLYFTATSLVLIAVPRVRDPFDLINCVGIGLLAAWCVKHVPSRARQVLAGPLSADALMRALSGAKHPVQHGDG